MRELVQNYGWDEGQLRWDPEWRVPVSPHDSAKRDAGKAFTAWQVDLAVFDDAAHAGDWQHIRAIFEFKEPTLNEGVSQLEIYLAREPRARMGYWTNSKENVRVYKLADGTFLHQKGRGLPTFDEDLSRATEEPLRSGDLAVPTARQLHSLFEGFCLI